MDGSDKFQDGSLLNFIGFCKMPILYFLFLKARQWQQALHVLQAFEYCQHVPQTGCFSVVPPQPSQIT